MTFEEFDKFQAELYAEILKIGASKGKEYANSADRFGNFKRVAERKGISPLAVAGIYLDKHYDSIDSFIKTGQTFSEESIRGRFKDAILYLFLMAGIVHETEQQSKFLNKSGTITRKHQPFEFDPKDGGPE